MYHSGTLLLRISACHSSGIPFPLRTCSIIWKAVPSSKPYWIKVVIISSRQPITSDNSTTLFLINSWAFPNQTSVPCESPEIWSNSAKVLGFVSETMPRTKPVPNSGTPSVPVSEFICSGVTPSTSVPLNICITFSSTGGISIGSIPLKSCNIRIMVGSSWPRISSFKTLASIEWKSKCVVFHSAFTSSAGYCTGVKS